MDWLAAHIDLSRPDIWALGSCALAVLAGNAAWLLSKLASGRRRLARLGRSSGVQALAWLIGALYLLLPPFAAWRYGAISPYLLGLAELDWIGSISAGGLIVVAIIGLMVFGWLVYRHSATPATETCADEGRLVMALRAPVDAALAQWHLAFYRAAQEALTNVRKHAHAQNVAITLDYSRPDWAALTVADDGVGCAEPSGGFGLLGLRERLRQLGGQTLIASAVGQGFTLRVEAPA